MPKNDPEKGHLQCPHSKIVVNIGSISNFGECVNSLEIRFSIYSIENIDEQMKILSVSSFLSKVLEKHYRVRSGMIPVMRALYKRKVAYIELVSLLNLAELITRNMSREKRNEY